MDPWWLPIQAAVEIVVLVVVIGALALMFLRDFGKW